MQKLCGQNKLQNWPTLLARWRWHVNFVATQFAWLAAWRVKCLPRGMPLPACLPLQAIAKLTIQSIQQEPHQRLLLMALFKLGMEIEFVHGASWHASTSGYLPSPFLSHSCSCWPYSHGPGTARVPQNEFAHCTKFFNPILLPQLSGWVRGGRATGHAGTVTRCWVQLTYLQGTTALYWILGAAFYRLLLATRSTCQRLLRWWV